MGFIKSAIHIASFISLSECPETFKKNSNDSVEVNDGKEFPETPEDIHDDRQPALPKSVKQIQ